MQYYNYRYLMPCLGRWIRRDQIEEKAGINLYCFTNNNNINLYDDNGLLSFGSIIPFWGTLIHCKDTFLGNIQGIKWGHYLDNSIFDKKCKDCKGATKGSISKSCSDYISLKAATFSFKELINVIPNVGIDLLLYKKDYIVKIIAMELMQKYGIGSIIPFYNKLLLIDAVANITCTINNIVKILIASNEAIEKYCTCK